MNNLKDIAFLEMAYGLAEKARGRASPNPYVGAVVVKGEAIVGYGYHEGPGKPHAERIALDRAGILNKASTLYTTLEPCVHWGRTPPCVDRILEARPRKAVVSSLDPNPLVFKKGIKKMKEAGIEVSLGLLEEKNRRMNEAYIKYITQKIPFIILKAALSLDGRIATKRLDSRWISSSQTREYAHLLRGEVDAIMVGINTILHDDPQLTVRHPLWKEKKGTRVILDSHLRLPLKARILSTLSQGKILILALRRASLRKMRALEKRGVEVATLPGSHGVVDIQAALRYLGQREIASVLVEGGSQLMTALLEQRAADKVFLTLSPKLIGGVSAPSCLEGMGAALIQDAWELKRVSSFKMGDEIILEGYF